MEPGSAGRDARAASSAPYLSLIVPAYNEGARLGDTLRAVTAYLARQPYAWEVVVVDDGSDDETLALARDFAVNCPCVVVVANPHRGKAYAVRSGVRRARGKLIGFTDADLSTPVEAVAEVLPRIA
ncbi:MAG TPA: glycosyltransferase, partial [Thermomicrobiales bacterium]|nr:glycosyltransferase [Thermomicrobiales bacterium]